MKTVKERMVEVSQLNKHISSVLEEQNGEIYLCEEIYPCEESIHSNEENEENDDNFPTEIKVTITNKLLENTEAKTEEEENTPQKETAKGAAIKQGNEMRKRKPYETYMEKLNLQVEDQHQNQPDPIEEDAEEDDEGPLHAEDLSQANSVHEEGGKESEDDEVPPGMERTRCNKAAEDEYLEEITQRREQVAWPNKKRNYGGKSIRTDQHKGLEANNVQEYLRGEWQKTKHQIMTGRAKVFGENEELPWLATNEFHKFPMEEPTADKNKSSKGQTMKYRLIIQNTQEGVRIIQGPGGNGIQWTGKMIHKCQCYWHRRLWKIMNMKEFEDARKHNCIKALYQMINPEDNQEEFKMTVIEYNEDIMHLVWRGGIPNLENIRHHASQCVKWIAVTNPSRKNRRSNKRNLSWQRTNNPEAGCLRHDYSLNLE